MSRSFAVFLGPTNTGLAYADFTLDVWGEDGVAIDTATNPWTWTEQGSRGRFLITIPDLADGAGCDYDLRRTATGSPWTQGRVAALEGTPSVGSIVGQIDSAATEATASKTAALRAMMHDYLSVERWTGLSAAIDSGTLAVGQRITVYHAPNDAPANDQIIAHIESDGTVTFDGVWTPPAEIETLSVLKLENDAGGVEIPDPVVITLTITSDEEPQNGSTITVTIPGTNAAGDDRCWYVKPDGTLVRCGGGHLVPDTRLTQAAGGGGTASIYDAGVTVE